MLLVICIPCALAVRVLAPLTPDGARETEYLVGPRSDFWPDQYPCPRCERMCIGIREADADPRVYAHLEFRDLTPQEAFAAFNRLGFPEEQSAALADIEKLLIRNPVCAVRGRDVPGAARAIIDHLELADGTKVYFGAGTEGAVVYRVVPPFSYASRALGPTP